jgi:hypothetical protein
MTIFRSSPRRSSAECKQTVAVTFHSKVNSYKFSELALMLCIKLCETIALVFLFSDLFCFACRFGT